MTFNTHMEVLTNTDIQLLSGVDRLTVCDIDFQMDPIQET